VITTAKGGALSEMLIESEVGEGDSGSQAEGETARVRKQWLGGKPNTSEANTIQESKEIYLP